MSYKKINLHQNWSECLGGFIEILNTGLKCKITQPWLKRFCIPKFMQSFYIIIFQTKAGVNISHYSQIFHRGNVYLFWRIWGRVLKLNSMFLFIKFEDIDQDASEKMYGLKYTEYNAVESTYNSVHCIHSVDTMRGMICLNRMQ